MGQKYIIGGPGAPAPFDASLPEQEMENKAYTSEVQMALMALQAGATPPAISDLLAPWNPISILRGGDPAINMSAIDLYALQVLWLKRNPITLLSANDNERLWVSGLSIPVWQGPLVSTIKIKATRVAPAATLDTLTHTIMQRYSPSRPSNVPVYLRLLQQSFTPATTGAYASAGRYANTGNIVGMLIFSTTIPVVGAYTTSAKGIRLTATNFDPLEFDWITGGADAQYKALFASPANLTILDNYRYWDLSDTPIPAASNPLVEIFADDANLVRYVFVEQVRP